MSLTVDFLGIIYFDADSRQPGVREVVIINGFDGNETVAPGVTPHVATIEIESDRVVGHAGWIDPVTKKAEFISTRTVDLTAGRERLARVLARTASVFGSGTSSSLPPAGPMVAEEVDVTKFRIATRSTITITGLTGAKVDTTQHDGRLPKLKDLDPPVFVDLDKADAIARLTISNGRLLARRLPAANGNGAIVSQLQVDGPLGTIAITVDDGVNKRTIDVKDDTEIVIANVSPDTTGGEDENAHFQLYRKLSPRNTETLPAPVIPGNVLPLGTEHPSIVDPFDIPEEKCSNTCCGRKG